MDQAGIDLFNKAGIQTDTGKKDPETLLKVISDDDALVVRSATRVTREVLEAGSRGSLKIVGRAGVGYDNIDLAAASEYGIIVKFAPYGNTNSAAQMALALILNVSRKIPQAHYSLKNGIWQKKQFEGAEITPDTILGIIGCGRIGQRLSQLVSGLDMKVMGYDTAPERVKSEFPHSRIEYKEKGQVLRMSDFVSIHVDGDIKVIGEQELSLMKPSAYLINVSRGLNVGEDALYQALVNKTIAGAGLDVYQNEPKEGARFESNFARLENIVLTPHLGASTIQAQEKTSKEIAEAVIGFLLGGDYTKALNARETVQAEERPTYTFFVHHLDQPGVFADITAVLREARINIRENPSRQIGVNGAAHTTYIVHSPITPELLQKLNTIPGVYRAVQ